MAEITYGDFERVEIRVGKIIKLYNKEELVGQLVTAVTNFPHRQVADFMSEVLVLGVVLDNDEVALIKPDKIVPLGHRVL